ncbi:Transmembrane amino acid transporter family protein [Candida albicans]|uniref:Transmembrane amino acid transporter family protein n=1 Tax=Candida albicans TaxID=5476 RepID=A0A8H6EZV9_CANAX|nr:Transmembrane amino acid transporter family protein [Candida albicans]
MSVPKTKSSSNGYTSVPQGENQADNLSNSETLTNNNQERSTDEYELQTLNSLDYEVENGPEEQQEEEQTGSSTMKMAFMNMANSILGAGIIGQPYAFRNSGLIGGILIMILLTVLIDWTLRLIIKNSILSQTKSYQDTVNYCFGVWGKIVLLVSICSFAYGGCMAFCVIIGDTIPHVLKAFIPESITRSDGPLGWLFARNTIIVLFTTCISYPLSLNRDISKLAKASGFALVGMFIIVVLTIFRAPFVSPTIKGISVISFALVCHHNTMFIYQSMKNPSLAKFSKLTHISCLVSMIFCMIMAINGLINLETLQRGTFSIISKVMIIGSILPDFKASVDGSTADLELSSKQHFFITSFLVFSSMSVALFTCNLGMILELVGATSASLMAYIIPPLCYLKLSWNQAIPSIACVLFGFAVMFISSFMTIKNTSSDGGDHCVID